MGIVYSVGALVGWDVGMDGFDVGCDEGITEGELDG